MIFKQIFVICFFAVNHSLRIQYVDNLYKFSDLKNLNYFYNPKKLENEYKTNKIYNLEFPFSNPLFIQNPKKSRNLSVNFQNTCLLPVICAGEFQKIKINFDHRNNITMRCDQTNFDLLGLNKKHALENQIVLNNNNLKNFNFNVWQFRQKFQKHKNYDIAIFCLHFKDTSDRTLKFNIKFLQKNFIISQYVEQINYHKEDILQDDIKVDVYESKQKHVRFKDNFEQLKLIFPQDYQKNLMVFINFQKKNVTHFLIPQQQEQILYDVENVVIKFISLEEQKFENVLQVEGLVQKPFGYQFEEEIEEDSFQLIATLLLFLTAWTLNSYEIITLSNLIQLIIILAKAFKNRFIIPKTNQNQSFKEFNSPEKIFSKRTIESNNKLIHTETQKEQDIADDCSWTSCYYSNSDQEEAFQFDATHQKSESDINLISNFELG